MTSSYSLDDWVYFTKAWNLNTAKIHEAGRKTIGKNGEYYKKRLGWVQFFNLKK